MRDPFIGIWKDREDMKDVAKAYGSIRSRLEKKVKPIGIKFHREKIWPFIENSMAVKKGCGGITIEFFEE
jgi:hypothetical protein